MTIFTLMDLPPPRDDVGNTNSRPDLETNEDADTTNGPNMAHVDVGNPNIHMENHGLNEVRRRDRGKQRRQQILDELWQKLTNT